LLRNEKVGCKGSSRFVRIVVLSIVATLPCLAQMENEGRGFRAERQAISYEAISMFGDDSSKAVVGIHYRIKQDFFIFVRNVPPQPDAQYVARGELSVELQNDQKVPVAREMRQIVLERSTQPRENEPLPDLEGAFSFRVPGGTYNIIVSLDDRESGRTFLERDRRVVATQPTHKPLELSDAFFVLPEAAGPAEGDIVPLNDAGNVLYGGSGGLITEIFQPDSASSLEVHWHLRGQSDLFARRTEEFSDSTFLPADGLLELNMREGKILYSTKPSALPWKTCFIPLPIEKLDPGTFTLDVEFSLGKIKRAQHHAFRVIWPLRPISLTDPDLAVEALRHIATDQQVYDMQSGSSAHRARAFYDFWKAKDPDTTTAYNEVMAEYYYRVDEAMHKFSTTGEGDGYKTDRGRIYILYGPPEQTNHLLQPGSAPTEIWTYDRLKRRFVFIDPTKTGTYVLSQAENL
jgi:GWxTD domain-containing protein